MVPKKKIQDYTADAMREAMDDAQLNNLSIRGRGQQNYTTFQKVH